MSSRQNFPAALLLSAIQCFKLTVSLLLFFSFPSVFKIHTRIWVTLCFLFSLIPVFFEPFVWFTIDQLRLDQACQHNRYKSHLAGTVYFFSFFAVFVWDFLLR